ALSARRRRPRAATSPSRRAGAPSAGGPPRRPRPSPRRQAGARSCSAARTGILGRRLGGARFHAGPGNFCEYTPFMIQRADLPGSLMGSPTESTTVSQDEGRAELRDRTGHRVPPTPALVVTFCADEPERTGEVIVLPAGDPGSWSVLGRGPDR